MKNVFVERRKDGENKGFYARVYEILKRENLPDQFTKDDKQGYMPMPAKTWKLVVNRKMKEREQKRMQEWIKEEGERNNKYGETKKRFGQEAYITKGNREGVALKMAFRGGAWALRGNKTAERRKPEKDGGKYERGCRWCEKEESEETERHLVDECTEMKGHRGDFVRQINAVRGEKWRTLGNQEQSALMREMKGLNSNGWQRNPTKKERERESKVEMASRRFMNAIAKDLKTKTRDNLMGRVQGQFGSETDWMRRQLDLDYADIVAMIERDEEEHE